MLRQAGAILAAVVAMDTRAAAAAAITVAVVAALLFAQQHKRQTQARSASNSTLELLDADKTTYKVTCSPVAVDWLSCLFFQPLALAFCAAHLGDRSK